MEHYGWTTDRYLAVAQFNLTQSLLYSFVQSKTKRKVPIPQQWPTPGKPKKAPEPDGGFAEVIARAKARRQARLGE